MGSGIALGLDFGTESVRALLVDWEGNEHASAVVRYRHGQIVDHLPDTSITLPPRYALQHPMDWIDAAASATRRAMKEARIAADAVRSIGVDFTSCTMLPARADGTPLALDPVLRQTPLAWPKLWKHHGAIEATDRINRIAQKRNEPWLARYGGIIGLEWFFPKVLETFDQAREIFEAADVWLEAGDWFVWQLVGGPAETLPRSTCQAGYKAMWSRAEGYPPKAFFDAVRPGFSAILGKLPGQFLAPGESAGTLTPEMSKRFGLLAGTPVSAAIIDAHAGVPGAGVGGTGTLVMVLGTSSCHMINGERECLVPGVAGVVEGGILPGHFGYETGQAAVGDTFDWFRRFVGAKSFSDLDARAAELPYLEEDPLALDWLAGCRTPLMDGRLTGAVTGLTLAHRPEHLYRAWIEASAFGLRWIIDVLRAGGVPVRKLVATGGLPHHNPLLPSIYASVLKQPILIHPSKQGPALGAAILGVLAAGGGVTGFRNPAAAIRAMAAAEGQSPARQPTRIEPNRSLARLFDKRYARYRALAEQARTGWGDPSA